MEFWICFVASRHFCLAAATPLLPPDDVVDEVEDPLELPHALRVRTARTSATGSRRGGTVMPSSSRKSKTGSHNQRDVATLATLFPPGSQLPRALYGALLAIVSWRARQTTKRMLPDAYVSRLRDARAAVARGLTGLGSRTPAADSLHAVRLSQLPARVSRELGRRRFGG